MITAAQLRAARGLLDWTRADLAKAANISPETVKNIEHGTFRPQEGTADAIVRAFAQYNVAFTVNEGVQLIHDKIERFEGPEGFKRFMDDVYAAAKLPSAVTGGDRPICVSNVDDRLFMKYLGDYMMVHARRMDDLKNVRVRALVEEDDLFFIPDSKYPEYRWFPKQTGGNVPFYVYGDKFAILLLNEEKNIQIISISSALVAAAYREQFELLWKNSSVPKVRG
jgi:DNA-binding XRE family transcriptional regulator